MTDRWTATMTKGLVALLAITTSFWLTGMNAQAGQYATYFSDFSPVTISLSHSGVLYSVTTTGTVDEGVDGLGDFGPKGASLIGDAYTLTNTIDRSTAEFFDSGGGETLYGLLASFTTQVTIDGHTATYNRTGFSEISVNPLLADGYPAVLIATSNVVCCILSTNWVVSQVAGSIPTDSIDQTITYSPDYAQNDRAFSSFNVVSEPASCALLIAGLTGLVLTRKHKSRRSSPVAKA